MKSLALKLTFVLPTLLGLAAPALGDSFTLRPLNPGFGNSADPRSLADEVERQARDLRAEADRNAIHGDWSTERPLIALDELVQQACNVRAAVSRGDTYRAQDAVRDLQRALDQVRYSLRDIRGGSYRLDDLERRLEDTVRRLQDALNCNDGNNNNGNGQIASIAIQIEQVARMAYENASRGNPNDYRTQQARSDLLRLVQDATSLRQAVDNRFGNVRGDRELQNLRMSLERAEDSVRNSSLYNVSRDLEQIRYLLSDLERNMNSGGYDNGRYDDRGNNGRDDGRGYGNNGDDGRNHGNSGGDDGGTWLPPLTGR